MFPQSLAAAIIALALAATAPLSAAAARPADSYTAEAFHSTPPQELSAVVRDALSSVAVRVTGARGVYCEIWLRKVLPAKPAPAQALGIAYGQLNDGELIGAIRFVSPVKDYRDQEIAPGVYTLRYALQPVDGNHQGVSPYRDFLLLAPATADSSPARLPTQELFSLSRQAARTGHPSVWSLLPAEDAPATLPGVAHQPDGGLWVLYFAAPLAAEGSAAGVIPMALVLIGQAAQT